MDDVLKVGDESQLLTGDQGHLVSQILETQKELADPTTSLETTSKFDIVSRINTG